jgi:DNA-binding winged helix-turn-helix (wHTH) protein
MSEYPPHPLSYRAKLLSRLMPSLRAGECCSLVGLSGVGKSNLVRFLRRRDVQSTYWKTDTSWVVLIDTHGLVFVEHTIEYIVAELMVHRLIMEIESRGLSSEVVAWANDLHARLIAQPSAHMALRYLERLCGRLCEGNSIQLIFVFDQFEDLWRAADAHFFLNLRSLRDQFKYQIVYLVITREPLQRSRADHQTTEAFWELFDTHVYALGMYSDDDARVMLERLAERRGTTLDPTLQRLIIRAGGRHPGLMRALVGELSQRSMTDWNDAELLALPAVAQECQKIWSDFTPDEQRLVRLLAGGRQPHQSGAAILGELQFKEIVAGDPPMLFSPIFSAFAMRQSDISGVVVVLGTRQVWLDGQLLPKTLPPLEFELLAYLARHTGSVCKREDIIQELYKERAYDGNDERLDTLLRRLREALGEDARSPRYLVTHRGAGVQLTHGVVE